MARLLATIDHSSPPTTYRPLLQTIIPCNPHIIPNWLMEHWEDHQEDYHSFGGESILATRSRLGLDVYFHS